MLGEGVSLVSVHEATTRTRAPFGTISASPPTPTVTTDYDERKLSATSGHSETAAGQPYWKPPVPLV